MVSLSLWIRYWVLLENSVQRDELSPIDLDLVKELDQLLSAGVSEPSDQ